NLLTQTPLLGHIAKAFGGIAQKRRMPPFATQTFKQWFRRRGPRNLGKPAVILWPDTFNNYFLPETAKAAVEVLEAAGFQVVVPQGSLCCGRPLYDFGMLNLAKRLLRQILIALQSDIAAGTPVVGLEPSCVAVFRDELVNFFPHDEDAKRLSKQTFTLAEFLEHKAAGYEPAQLHRKAVVHGHCHQKAVMGMKAEEKVLSKLGLDLDHLDSGCCGMAGSFGFKKEHYDISMKIGELVLLPAVRKATKDTVIIADGFSCREQIRQATDRQALHLAQVLQMALRQGPDGPSGEYPEAGYTRSDSEYRRMSPATALLGVGCDGIAGALLWRWNRRKEKAN
nr:FAD-binding oxidoreductase [Nitrospira sp.]